MLRGRRLVSFAIACLLLLPEVCGQAPAADAPATVGVIIEFEGDIHSLSEQYLYRKLDEAQDLNASLVVIQIDSPGGDVEATMRMAERLRDLVGAKTVSYVPRTALSGAALMSLGCDEIVMAPTAVLGDAGPIFLDENFLFQHASEKVRSHLARQVRDLAESAGRPPALAEAMVDMDLVVYAYTHRETGELRYFSEAEVEASDEPQIWQKGPPVLESREAHFLEVNGRRAVELGLADATVNSKAELQARYPDVTEWVELESSGLDTLIVILNHPFVTGLLLVIGMAALYGELAAPGLGIGGLITVACFGLFFWSRFLGGTAEWLDVVLFIMGIGLLFVEFFVIPGFGIWGITGAIMILAALVLASQPFLVPRTQQELNSLTTTLTMVMLSGVGFLVVAAWLTRRIGAVPGLNQLLLRPPTLAVNDAHEGPPTEIVVEGRAIRVGERGRAESPLRPAGRIRIGDDYVDVVSDGSFIDPAELVEVIDVRGNRVVVRKVQ